MNTRYLWIPILLTLSGCDQKPKEKTIDQQAVKSLVQESLNNMVHIQGGTFMMGDFGHILGDRLPLTGNNDDKKTHKVTLSDFSIGKYKVTFKEYDEYTMLNKKKKYPR